VRVSSLLNCIGCVCLVITACCGCATRVEDLTRVSPFSEQINQKYVLNSDCYAVRFVDSNRTNPCIKCGVTDRLFPNPADASLIGQYISNGRILGILPKGSILRINKIARGRTFESTYYTYLVAVEGPASHLWLTLDASLIIDPTKTPPIISPRVASPAFENSP
jgi:hypothetical protein